MKRQWWANTQYSRLGIPSNVEANVLEEKVVNIFEKWGYSIPFRCIQACHRVSKESTTFIVNVSSRKYRQQGLRKIKMEDVDLPSPNKHLIYKDLCQYYKVLRSKSKRLPSLGKINGFFILGDTIKIKVSENSLSLCITHVDEYQKYFLASDPSSPGRSI